MSSRLVFSLVLMFLAVSLAVACAPSAPAPPAGTAPPGSRTTSDSSAFDKAKQELEALKKDTGTGTTTPGTTSTASGLPDLVIDEIYLEALTRKGATGACGVTPLINTDGKSVRVDGTTIDYLQYESWSIIIKVKNLGPGTLNMAGKGAGKIQQWVDGNPVRPARFFYADRSDLTVRAGDFVLSNTSHGGLRLPNDGGFNVKFRVNYEIEAAKGYEQPLPESNYNNNERDFKLTIKPCPPKK